MSEMLVAIYFIGLLVSIIITLGRFIGSSKYMRSWLFPRATILGCLFWPIVFVALLWRWFVLDEWWF